MSELAKIIDYQRANFNLLNKIDDQIARGKRIQDKLAAFDANEIAYLQRIKDRDLKNIASANARIAQESKANPTTIDKLAKFFGIIN